MLEATDDRTSTAIADTDADQQLVDCPRRQPMAATVAAAGRSWAAGTQ